MGSRALHYDDSDFLTRTQAPEIVEQLVRHFDVDRVQPLGPIQGDPLDSLPILDADEFKSVRP
jgi:hypothetical protein